MSVLLAFYKGTKAENPSSPPFDRLVCWWPRSRGRFAHVEFVADRHGSLGVCWSSSMRDGGVRRKEIDLASGHWVIVSLPFVRRALARTWFEGAEGRAYDYPGILGFAIPFVKELRRWLYCSESVAKALSAGGCGPATSNIAPSALYAWAIAQPGAESFELPVVTQGGKNA